MAGNRRRPGLISEQANPFPCQLGSSRRHASQRPRASTLLRHQLDPSQRHGSPRPHPPPLLRRQPNQSQRRASPHEPQPSRHPPFPSRQLSQPDGPPLRAARPPAAPPHRASAPPRERPTAADGTRACSPPAKPSAGPGRAGAGRANPRPPRIDRGRPARWPPGGVALASRREVSGPPTRRPGRTRGPSALLRPPDLSSVEHRQERAPRGQPPRKDPPAARLSAATAPDPSRGRRRTAESAAVRATRARRAEGPRQPDSPTALPQRARFAAPRPPAPLAAAQCRRAARRSFAPRERPRARTPACCLVHRARTREGPAVDCEARRGPASRALMPRTRTQQAGTPLPRPRARLATARRVQ